MFPPLCTARGSQEVIMFDYSCLFVVYLTLVRLALIAAGIGAIHYGYKLFGAGVFKMDRGGANTEMSGRIGDYEFKFKTAAPGTVLGLFGAVIIVVTMLAAPPELTRDKKTKEETSGITRTITVESTEKMRGEAAALTQLLKEAAEYKKGGDDAKAISTYHQAIRLLTVPMNDLAQLYAKAHRLNEAKKLAEVAVMMDPSVPDFGITLESINRSLKENK
jgi:hypothetical protein